MPTQAAPDNKQKANITTAIENTGCPSIALDEAAPIICTKVLAALMDPMISGICRRASFVAHGEISLTTMRHRPSPTPRQEPICLPSEVEMWPG